MSQMVYISGGDLHVEADSFGAQLMSIKLDGREYLWQGDPTWWGKRAPVLFPMVGSLRNNTARCANGDCNMARHGIARIVEHEIVAVGDDFVTFMIESNEESKKLYPFDFVLRITYRVGDDNSLKQEFVIENTGDVLLPFAVGGHPAFNVPLCEGESFEDYSINFTRTWDCASPVSTEEGLIDTEFTSDLLNGEKSIALEHSLFDEDAMIFIDVPDNTVELSGPSGHGVRVVHEGFKYLGIWSALGDAPFVALEPWTGHATACNEDDVFEHKAGMTLLAPGRSKRLSFTMKFF